jgi:hypothetical protein
VVIPGYTQGVKTAISVPEDTFSRATRRARELGMSRSEFFSRAALRYLDELDGGAITERIDQTIEAAGVDGSTTDAVTSGRRTVLDEDSDDW